MPQRHHSSTSALVRRWMINVTLQLPYPGKETRYPLQKQRLRVPPGTVWTSVEKINSLASTGFRTPHPPACSKSQYRLRHRTVGEGPRYENKYERPSSATYDVLSVLTVTAALTNKIDYLAPR